MNVKLMQCVLMMIVVLCSAVIVLFVCSIWSARAIDMSRAEVYGSILARDLAMLNKFAGEASEPLRKDLSRNVVVLVDMIGLIAKKQEKVGSVHVVNAVELAFSSLEELSSLEESSSLAGSDVEGVRFLLANNK